MLSNYEILTIKNDGLKYEVQEILETLKIILILDNYEDILEALELSKDDEKEILKAIEDLEDKDSFLKDTAFKYFIMKIEEELKWNIIF